MGQQKTTIVFFCVVIYCLRMFSVYAKYFFGHLLTSVCILQNLPNNCIPKVLLYTICNAKSPNHSPTQVVRIIHTVMRVAHSQHSTFTFVRNTLSFTHRTHNFPYFSVAVSAFIYANQLQTDVCALLCIITKNNIVKTKLA